MLSLALAVAFSWAFMFLKHDPSLRNVIPFGVDPYDAVGSFATIIALLVATIAVIRAFRPYHSGPSLAQQVYLRRAQMAVALAVYITVGSDIIAMARHPAMWIDAPSRTELIVLLTGPALAAAGLQLLIRTLRVKGSEAASEAWKQAAIVVLVAALILAFYPEQLVVGFWSHMGTVIVGDLILFAPMRPLLVATVPYSATDTQSESSTAPRQSMRGRRWVIVTLIGAAVGVFALLGELSEGSAPPAARLLLLVAVFLGLAIAGLLIAFVCLGAPLGFAAQRRL